MLAGEIAFSTPSVARVAPAKIPTHIVIHIFVFRMESPCLSPNFEKSMANLLVWDKNIEWLG
jgi:hypothetical protein